MTPASFLYSTLTSPNLVRSRKDIFYKKLFSRFTNISHNEKITVSCLNPHSYYLSKLDANFYNSLVHSSYLLPDGIGVVIGGKILGLNFFEKICGYDLLISTLNFISNNNENINVLFFGSTDKTLDLIRAKLALNYPHLDSFNFYSPPFVDKFDNLENSEIVSKINKLNPDILFIGLGAPKQEKWLYSNQHLLTARLCISIGAAFDFYAETVPRCPYLMEKFHLEWLYRLIKEPIRLWRRSFISAPIFLFDLLLCYVQIFLKKN